MPLYATKAQVAKMLCQTIDWFDKNRHTLEAASGFPKIDPVIGRWHIESVEAWARERNMRSRRAPGQMVGSHRENQDAF